MVASLSYAADLGLGPAQWVFVESPRGKARVRAFITPTVQQGHLFLPMHDSSTNHLTLAVFDPESRQPAYKSCAARVRAVGQTDVLAETQGASFIPLLSSGADSNDCAES